MLKKGRVLFTWKGEELFIEQDDFEEKLAFSSSNGLGFTAVTLEEMEKLVKGTESAIREFKGGLVDLKDVVSEKAPGLLGYDGYVSTKEIKRLEEEKNADVVLTKMKAFTGAGDDAI